MTLAILLIACFIVFFLLENRSREKVVQPIMLVALAFCEFSAYIGSLEEKALIGFIFFMWLVGIKGRGRSDFKMFKLARSDYLLSAFLFVYLIFQSGRSAVEYSRGAHSYYWPIFFGCLFILMYACRECKAEGHSREDHALVKSSRAILALLSVYGLVLITSYLLVFLHLIPDDPRLPYKTSLIYPFTCFMPLVFLHFKYDSAVWGAVSVSVVFLGIVGAVLISSRAALAPLIFLLLLMFLSARIGYLRRFIVIAVAVGGAGLLTVLLGLGGDLAQTLADTVRIISVNAESNEQNSDIDRIIHYIATWEVVSRDWGLLVFGGGFRSSGYLLAPALADYYHATMPTLDFETELGSYSDAYTFGWNGLLIDLGLVGVFLVIMCIIKSGVLVLKGSTGAFRAVLIATIAVFTLRLFANNYASMALFYIMLAPCFVYGYFLRVAHALERVR